MNRSLPYINLLGVVALSVLCVFQWSTNRSANLEVARLEKVRIGQVTQLAEREKALQGCQGDLESFRTQLVEVNTRWKENEKKITSSDRELQQITAERDQLKTNITMWTEAVAVRDERLKKVNAEIQTLAADRNEAVTKYNELAAKQNQTVKDFNELIVKYNQLVSQATNPPPAAAK